MDFFRIAIEKKATDLHIEAGGNVACRSFGRMVPLGACSREAYRMMEDRLLAYQAKDTFIVKNDENRVKDFSCHADEFGRLRVRRYRSQGKACMAIRFLPQQVPTPEALKWPQTMYSFPLQQQGLILVTGASGSGKSTTLAAMIEAINRQRACHIVTFEEPIEYVFQGKQALIHQCAVPDDVGSFAEGAKDALRMDADVIMLGELSDLETMRAALKLVESGHLVLATMHTGAAAEAVGYFVHHFPAAEQSLVCHQLSMMLRAVVSQRLLPHAHVAQLVPVYEILLRNQAVARQIRDGDFAQLAASMELGHAEGMMLLEEQLAELVQKEMVTYSDALLAANHPERLRQIFEKKR